MIREQTKIDCVCIENAFFNQMYLKNTLCNTQLLNIYKGLDLSHFKNFNFFL